LRRSDLTPGNRHFARKRVSGGSDSPPPGPDLDLANLKVGLTPVIHAGPVSSVKTRRNEAFEVAADRVLFRAAEQALRRGIEKADSTILVDSDDSIRRRLDDGRQSVAVQKQCLVGRGVRAVHFGKVSDRG
jgi:hypothetical protein